MNPFLDPNITESTQKTPPPPPPPPVDATVTVAVSADKRSAALLLTPPENDGKTLTQMQLKEAVVKAGIVFGVRDDIIAQLAAAPIYNSAVPIAQARQPENGRDGRIEFHFTTDRERRPQLRPDGTVDYKELGDLPNVRKGERLCTLYKGELGTPGLDIFGVEIPPKPGKTPRLTPTKNTVIDESGVNLLSIIDGQVTVDSNNRVIVSNTYTVEGNVDMSTGNVTFVGHVIVNGSVSAGLTVRAEGSVTVRGGVDCGSIYAGGSVVITNGYLGNETSEIIAGGNLQCKHIHHGRVSVEGMVETEHIYHSHIRCGGSVKVQGNHSTITGGQLFVLHDVDCRDVGSRMSGFETYIEVGSDPLVSIRASAIPQEELVLDKRINDVGRVAEVLIQLHERGRLGQDRQAEFSKVLFTLRSLQQRKQELAEEKLEIAERMRTIGYGTVTIRGTAYPGVRIVIGPESTKLNTPAVATRFFRSQNGLETAPSG